MEGTLLVYMTADRQVVYLFLRRTDVELEHIDYRIIPFKFIKFSIENLTIKTHFPL